ncbi:MAG: DMT family transporter [Saonia sp.]
MGNNKWFYFIVLSFVWGSSFILIKKALLGLTPMELGGLRILFASVFLFIIGFKSLRQINRKDWKWILAAGLPSSFFPPFLFALAQTEIDSGITSIFNSSAPLLTTLVGALFFGILILKRQVFGVFIGLLGTVALIVAGAEFNPDQNYWYAIFIILSALGYAFNINIVKKQLSHLSPLAVTTGSFGVAVLPALLLLFSSDFFNRISDSPQMHSALGYLLLLALFGTALANIFFNKLIHISNPVFAASVTYTIPLVAVFWGILDGERINAYQLIGGCIVLVGVYLVNSRKGIA